MQLTIPLVSSPVLVYPFLTCHLFAMFCQVLTGFVVFWGYYCTSETCGLTCQMSLPGYVCFCCPVPSFPFISSTCSLSLVWSLSVPPPYFLSSLITTFLTNIFLSHSFSCLNFFFFFTILSFHFVFCSFLSVRHFFLLLSYSLCCAVLCLYVLCLFVPKLETPAFPILSLSRSCTSGLCFPVLYFHDKRKSEDFVSHSVFVCLTFYHPLSIVL